MNTVTFSCNECHEVKLLIEVNDNIVSFKCHECGEIKLTKEIEKYRAFRKSCNCTSELYKVRIRKYLDQIMLDEIIIQEIKCEECDMGVTFIAVDKDGNEITEEKRQRLLNAVTCTYCRNYFFKIDNMSSISKAKCMICEKDIMDIECENYTSLKNSCSCGNNIFEMFKDEKIPTCRECGKEPEKIYVDNDGNEIDRITRELLIIQDKYDCLERQMDDIKDKLEYSIDDIESKVGNLRSKIFNQIDESYSLQNDIDNINSNVNQLKNRIDEVGYELHDL